MLYYRIATRGIAGEVNNIVGGKPVSMRMLLHTMLHYAGLDESRLEKTTPHAQVSTILADICNAMALTDNSSINPALNCLI